MNKNIIMEEIYKKITIRGRLKSGEPLIINWYDDTKKTITGDDFIFVLNDYDFFEKYKYIQDSNNLEFLKITKIEGMYPQYEILH